MAKVYTLSWCLAISIFSVSALPGNLLYPEDDAISLPIGDEISSTPIKLKVPIVYFGLTYKTIFVNTNGILSFQTEIPNFFNIEFPLDYSVIAPLYSNVDTSRTGTVTYYETQRNDLLQRANNNVLESFRGGNHINFEATSLFVVTWRNVGYHSQGTDKQNTYQVVVYTNGKESYVELLYPDTGIQWIQGTGDDSGLPDARAQAGLMSNDGRLHVLPGSGTDQVKNLVRWSNMKLPGQWLFRVGNINDADNVEQPDGVTDGSSSNLIPTTCAEASTQCHSHAKCMDLNDGFCCECKNNYYGNGKYCIKKDIPLRVNGKVNGKINGVVLENLDLQSYVVMLDGRAYTAMSKIPQYIGFDIQSVQVLGATIGWLFAKPLNGALNGYELTGGVFNHSATVTFPANNMKIEIRQKYLGLDVFDQLRLEVDINGELPRLPIDSKIIISEYKELYTLTAPGVVQSSSARVLKYENSNGNEVQVNFNLDQTFVFDFCEYADTVMDGVTWKLKVGKNFISYEAREQIIRFGMSSKMGPIGDIDPCEEGRATCGPNSACVVDEDNYRCICNPGYQQIHRDGEPHCADVNECILGVHDCDYNAYCHNEIGTFTCVCHAGFTGNGHYCHHVDSCEGVQCGDNAECVETGVAIAMCQCAPGFTGGVGSSDRGLVCVALPSVGCQHINNCSPYGYCSISQETGQYSCHCLRGYTGDGYNCEPEMVTAPTPDETTPYEQIDDGEYTPEQCNENGECVCLAGYKKVIDSSYCVRLSNEELTRERERQQQGVLIKPTGQDSCLTLNNCDGAAQCLYTTNGNYQCICNAGYDGDGYTCHSNSESCATEDICNENATCEYQRHSETYICMCNPGYLGNGVKCEPVATCTGDGDCSTNEECRIASTTRPTVTYQCACKDGFTRDDQQQCRQMADERSAVCSRCLGTAECLYDDSDQTYYCSCRSGYEGDGTSHCVEKPVGCNTVNNCGLYSTCAYQQATGAYKCQCTEGFEGDGFLCYPAQNCHTHPHICDPHAICVTDSRRQYVCECQRDYTGNGTTCNPAPRHAGNFLLLNQGTATLRIPFEVSRKMFGSPVQIKYNQIAVGMDVDCYRGRMYWSDIAGRMIRSASYNGSSKEDFITKDIGSPEGLAVDWVSRNIYWTDSSRDTVEVASLETKIRKTLFNTDLVNPRGIAVHPQRGKIFWSDWDRSHPKIEWSNTDGTDRQIFFEGPDVLLPNALAIDYFTEQLCYTDAGTKNIECISIDNRIKQTIAMNCTYPFGIAVTETHVYWSDWITKKIERVYKPTLKRVSALDVPLGGSGNKLYGLTAVPDQCSSLTNVCQYYKDQCPAGYLCLPDGKGSRRCVCGRKADSLEEPVCNDTYA